VNRRAKVYVSAVTAIAAGLLAWLLPSLDLADGPKAIAFALVALLASTFKVRIPGFNGHYSLNFLVLLASLWELSVAEILLMAAACGVMQSCWRAARRPQLVQVAFNSANVVLSMAGAWAIFRLFSHLPEEWRFLAGGLAAGVYYLVNGGLTTAVLRLVQGGGMKQIWEHWNFYALPYSVLGSTMATGWMVLRGQSHPQGMLVAVLALYFLFRVVRKSLSEQDLLGLRAPSVSCD